MPETKMDNTPSIWWQRIQWFFVLLAILPGVIPRSPGLSPIASHRVAGFRIGCILIGIVGWGATALIKRILYPPVRKIARSKSVGPPRLVMPLPGEAVAFVSPTAPVSANLWDNAAREAVQKKAVSVPLPPPTDAPRFFARYQSRGYIWGVDPWSLVFRSDTRMGFFGIPATASVLSLIITVRFSWAAVWKTVVGIWLTYAVVFMGMMAVEYIKKYPKRNDVRNCHVVLTPVGLWDTTPTSTTLVKWTQVQMVRQYQTKMYVYWTQGTQVFPVDGFENETDAQTFFDAAQTLWKSRGQIVPDALQVPALPSPPAEPAPVFV